MIDKMLVEFISPHNYSPHTGIGRYLHTLLHHLNKTINARIAQPRFLPFSDRFSPLQQLPVGILDHAPGSILHFPQIMGCALMLYHPYHPSVATVHDLGFLELPDELKTLDPVARQLLRLSLAGLKRVDKIIAVSEFTRQGVIKHLGIPAERVTTIHSGIDHHLFRPIPQARNSLIQRHPLLAEHARAPWLLYVGSEQPRKNLETLLQSVNLVRKELPEVILLKVGGSGGAQFRQETLRLVTQLNLADQILFFENIPDTDLPLFYTSADIFVTASKLEGFGFPVLEAMACGTPVICTKTASLCEIGKNAAIFIQSSDPSEMANAAICLLNDSHFYRLAIDNGIRQSSGFIWKNTCNKLISIYKNGF